MARNMIRRERVVAALNLQEPDRVPIDLGGTMNSTIHIRAYARLKQHLGLDIPGEPRLADRMMQVVDPDEEVLRVLDIDTRAVYEGPLDNSRSHNIDETTYVDDWGVIRGKPAGADYYDLLVAPLAGETSISAIADYDWPDPVDPGLARPILPRIEHLRRTTDCALILHLPSPFVHKSQYLMGFEDWFVNMALDQRLMGALFDAIVEISMAQVEQILRVAGQLIDAVAVGDDVGDQYGPIVSPELYRALILPRHQAYFAQVRSLTPAPILYHTCGSVYKIMEELIGLGIQALNPVQVSARDMEPARLKAEFGDRLAFWGGIDTQHTLPPGVQPAAPHPSFFSSQSPQLSFQ